MEKLKPCPFCGDIDGVQVICIDGSFDGSFDEIKDVDAYIAECQNIYCMFQPSGVFSSREAAIEHWNHRPKDKGI